MNLKGGSLRALIYGWKIVEVKWVAQQLRLVYLMPAYGLQPHETHQGRLEDNSIILRVVGHRVHLAVRPLLYGMRALASLSAGPCSVQAPGQSRGLSVGQRSRAVIAKSAKDSLQILVSRRNPRLHLSRIISAKGEPDSLRSGRDRYCLCSLTERKMQRAADQPLSHIHRNSPHIELKPRTIALHWTHHPIQHVAHRCYTVGRAQITVRA